MAITPSQIDAVDLLSKVHSFYEVAWVHLMWYIGVAGAIIGIIIPIALQVYQRRTFKFEESKIESHITAQLDSAKTEILTAVNERLNEVIKAEFVILEKKVADMEAKLVKEVDCVKGGVHQVQGNEQKTRGVYPNAILSFISAAEHQCGSDDERNLQRVLGSIEECLMKVTSVVLRKTPKIEENLSKLLDQLKNNNTNGRYANYIDRILQELRKAKEREEK